MPPLSILSLPLNFPINELGGCTRADFMGCIRVDIAKYSYLQGSRGPGLESPLYAVFKGIFNFSDHVLSGVMDGWCLSADPQPRVRREYYPNKYLQEHEALMNLLENLAIGPSDGPSPSFNPVATSTPRKTPASHSTNILDRTSIPSLSALPQIEGSVAWELEVLFPSNTTNTEESTASAFSSGNPEPSMRKSFAGLISHTIKNLQSAVCDRIPDFITCLQEKTVPAMSLSDLKKYGSTAPFVPVLITEIKPLQANASITEATTVFPKMLSQVSLQAKLTMESWKAGRVFSLCAVGLYVQFIQFRKEGIVPVKFPIPKGYNRIACGSYEVSEIMPIFNNDVSDFSEEYKAEWEKLMGYCVGLSKYLVKQRVEKSGKA